ncbi:MAG: hypothetical protein MUC91_05895 [Verrucomicrobia bacterium]|jgi:glycosyltransferase involved in cell wall biosynthesis|nr:hypothetical protein [Verrucomicrobiota bacterium]
MQRPGPAILFLNHNLAGQATYYRNINFAKGLANLGWEATMLTVAPKRRIGMRTFSEDGVRIIETPWILPSAFLAGNGCDPWDIVRRCFWCARPRFDVTVVSDHLLNVTLPFRVSRLFGRSRCYLADWADLFTRGGCHAGWNRGIRKPLHAISEHFEFSNKRACELAMATSRPLQKLLREDCGQPADRTLHLPSGCDPAIPFDPETEPTRIKLGMDPADFVVGRTGRTGIAGRLHDHEQKAFLAIHSFMRSQGLPPPVLYLVGNHEERWYPALLAAGCRLRISGLLPSPEVPVHLRACDVFILLEADTPFNRHRGPIRLNDYLVVGRPILCNSVGDHSETLASAGAGVVWDNLEDVPDGVCSLLLDSGKRRTMGANARALADGPLSWPRLAERLDQFILSHYPELARGRKPPAVGPAL